MPSVPLGLQAYSRSASEQPETRLVNLYLEEDVSGASPDKVLRLQRPGMTRTASLPGRVRALYQSDNSIASVLLMVAGSEFRMDDGTVIGTVEDDGDTARIVATFERIAVLSSGTVNLWDGETFKILQKRDNEVESAGNTFVDLEPIIDVDVLNGYILLASSNGTFYWLVPGEKSVNPLNYASAETLPDGCVAVRRLRDDLYFFGSQTIEVWQTTGDADAPFQRAAARLIDRGCASRDSIANFDNSLVWLGDDQIVYRLGEVPSRISTFGVEDKIVGRSDLPHAFAFTLYGHKFYVMTIPDRGTYAYDASTQIWSEFSWSARLGLDTLGGAFVADVSGGLFRLDPASSLDDGSPFLRLVSGTVALPAKPVANQSISVGVGSPLPSVWHVRWKDPRRDWSSIRVVSSRGDSDVLALWRLGSANAPYRTYEVSTLSTTNVRISGAMANETWRGR